MDRIVCFDLEGPLSPQDNAFEVMGAIPRGLEIFSALSTYDDILALEGRQDYEPGDTLKLEADIRNTGPGQWTRINSPPDYQIELDGQWYPWVGQTIAGSPPRSVIGRADGRSVTSR